MSKKKKVNKFFVRSENSQRSILKKETSTDIFQQLKIVNLKNYAYGSTVNETSPYTEVFGFQRRIVFKKTNLIWFLRKNEEKLSSDRLQRVMGMKKQEKIYKKFQSGKPIVTYFPKSYVLGKYNEKKQL